MTVQKDTLDKADISLLPVDPDTLDDVDAVFEELRRYSADTDGVAKRRDAAYAFFNAVPPGHPRDKKHAFLAKNDEWIVGLVDMIADYPAPGTVFVGLLAIREPLQGRGLGKALWLTAECFARDALNARRVRLAVVESNPVIGFWTKMGFQPTGEESTYNGERRTSRAILMEKMIVQRGQD